MIVLGVLLLLGVGSSIFIGYLLGGIVHDHK
jgi:hypothetical protein